MFDNVMTPTNMQLEASAPSKMFSQGHETQKVFAQSKKNPEKCLVPIGAIKCIQMKAWRGDSPRRKQSTSALASRHGVGHNTVYPPDRSRWDPRVTPYRCNMWSRLDASKCWVLRVMRTHRYHHWTGPPHTATPTEMLPSTINEVITFNWWSRKSVSCITI